MQWHFALQNIGFSEKEIRSHYVEETKEMTKIDSSLTKEMTKLSTFVTKVRENVSQIEEHQLVQQSPGGHFKNFWVGICRWDPGTLDLYQS